MTARPVFAGIVVAQLAGQALPEPLGALLAYGPAGIAVALWLTGWLPSRAELERTLARVERAEQQRDALTEKVVGEILPLLAEIQRTMIPTAERMTNKLHELTGEVRRMSDRMAELERQR